MGAPMTGGGVAPAADGVAGETNRVPATPPPDDDQWCCDRCRDLAREGSPLEDDREYDAAFYDDDECKCDVPEPEDDEPWVPARCALCGMRL